MIKIKPCPFCGNDPVLLPTNPKEEGDNWGAVQCVCGYCPARPRVSDGVAVSDDRGTKAYQQEAIRRWNVRWKQRPSGGSYE